MDDRETVTVGGLSFAYRQTTRSDNDIPVLFLHGLGDNADTWDAVTASLPDRWSIALDLRGHGRSAWTPDYRLSDMAGDVAGFLDALGVPRVDLVGHSMGAMVAYLFASAQPDRVRRLVLEEPPAPEPASPPRDEGDRPEGDLGYDWAIQAPFSRQRNHPDPAWRDALPRITAPTLIMTGTESHLPADATRRMADRIPNSQQVSFRTGHLVHEELPAEFIEALTTYLAKPAG
ncbi:MAG: alpha/beta hydrolase [Actinocatenispora sp.]